MAEAAGRRREPTAHDVARAAGVSQRTVSNVVNGYVHVSEPTRAKVQAAIDALGYRPNLAARRLREGRTGVIALAVPNLTWPYFAAIAHLVQRAAYRSGRTLLVAETEGNAQHESDVLAGLRQNLVDGLILSSIEMGADQLRAVDLGIPTVLLGERIQDAGLLHLSMDNVLAARQMTRHLHDQGARRFWVVGATATVATSSAGALRLRGFTEELADLGLGEDAWRVVPVSPWTQEGAYRAVAAELARTDGPTDAIFGMNDLLALGVLRACREAGLSVPGDVLVSGWDDIPEASYSAPALTTVCPDKDRIAQGAVDGLVGLIEGADVPPTDQVVPHTLSVRGSTVRG